MTTLLEDYAKVVGDDVVDQLYQLARPLKDCRVVHVNSTRIGGGVTEILVKLVPTMQELGMDASWEVISGEPDFYQCTKHFHNAIQGNAVLIPDRLLRVFEQTNEENAERLRHALQDADIVFIHDPQPAPLLRSFPDRAGRWIWRCHIDASRPYRRVWNYLRNHVAGYDASIFSLAAFAQAMPHDVYIIPPSIDPLTDKNIDLEEDEIEAVRKQFGIDPERPMILQVSRFDRFKDPLGVIEAYRHAKKFVPSLQLVLAGGGATDDPEGATVLAEVQAVASDDRDIKTLLLPPDAHRTINALQHCADIVLQKSLKEGFGLTVTEAMWKSKPVIGGNTGGIRIQIFNGETGYLVNTPEGAALRIRYLLFNAKKRMEMGANAKEFVRENYLLTRHLREYLTLMVALLHGATNGRIELG